MYCSGRAWASISCIQAPTQTQTHLVQDELLFLPPNQGMVINIFIGNQYLEMANGLVGLLFFCSCTQKSRPHYQKQLGSDRNHPSRGGASGIGDSVIAIDACPQVFFCFSSQMQLLANVRDAELFSQICALTLKFEKKILTSVFGLVIKKRKKYVSFLFVEKKLEIYL